MRPDLPQQATWLALVLLLSGFGALGGTWWYSAAVGEVWRQVPYTLSGGLIGLGLIGVGLALLNVQVTRLDDAAERQQYDELISHAWELLAATDDHRDPGEG